MAYERHKFEDQVTILNAQIMNKIEDGIVQADKQLNGPRKNLLVLGDSMFGLNAGQTFLKDFCKQHNLELYNGAVGGATFNKTYYIKTDGTTDEKYNNYILKQWNTFKKLQEGKEEPFIPDIILIDGGGNDYLKSRHFKLNHTAQSTMDKHLLYDQKKRYGYWNSGTQTSYDDWELTTYAQAEIVFSEIAEKYPTAKKFFLIIHNIYRTLSTNYLDDPVNGVKEFWNITSKTFYDGNTATFRDISDKLKNISNKYGFKCIDVNSNSFLHSLYDEKADVYTVTDFIHKDGIKQWNEKLYCLQRETGPAYLVSIECEDQINTTTMGRERIIPNLDYLDLDGIHPTALGYELGYKPNLQEAFNLIDNSEREIFNVKYIYKESPAVDAPTHEINNTFFKINDTENPKKLFTVKNSEGNNIDINLNNIALYDGNKKISPNKVFKDASFGYNIWYIKFYDAPAEETPPSISSLPYPNEKSFAKGLANCLTIEMYNPEIKGYETLTTEEVISDDKNSIYNKGAFSTAYELLRGAINIERVTGDIKIIFTNLNDTIEAQ